MQSSAERCKAWRARNKDRTDDYLNVAKELLSFDAANDGVSLRSIAYEYPSVASGIYEDLSPAGQVAVAEIIDLRSLEETERKLATCDPSHVDYQRIREAAKKRRQRAARKAQHA